MNDFSGSRFEPASTASPSKMEPPRTLAQFQQSAGALSWVCSALLKFAALVALPQNFLVCVYTVSNKRTRREWLKLDWWTLAEEPWCRLPSTFASPLFRVEARWPTSGPTRTGVAIYILPRSASLGQQRRSQSLSQTSLAAKNSTRPSPFFSVYFGLLNSGV